MWQNHNNSCLPFYVFKPVYKRKLKIECLSQKYNKNIVVKITKVLNKLGLMFYIWKQIK